MNSLLLLPPVSLLLLLVVFTFFAFMARRLSPSGANNSGKGEPYACGQEVGTGRIQPSYNEFFPFAFFFTIMHVATLMLCTIPAGARWLSVPFLAISVLAIIILFRKD